MVIRGKEYWFEPGRNECSEVLRISRNELGALGVKRSIINFYDYHQSTGCEDCRDLFLNRLTLTSEDNSWDGIERIHWKSYYSSDASLVRRAARDYLNHFLWFEGSERIMEVVDEHFQGAVMLTGFECASKTISVGEHFFNSVFYDSLVEVAVHLIPGDLLQEMTWGDEELIRKAGRYSRLENKLIVDYDEVQRFQFVLSKPMYEYKFQEPNRLERKIECSPSVLSNYLIPWITLISNWSLVLGVYLATVVFGSCAVSVGD